MNNNHVYDMLVVGGGPGGYTAALYAARSGLDTVVLEKLSAGGQMALTEQIDNYPGFENGIDGFSLAEKMQKQAERFGARSEYAEVLRMDLTAVPKLVETSEGIFRGKTVVLATGADPRTLGVAGESELVGRGVDDPAGQLDVLGSLDALRPARDLQRGAGRPCDRTAAPLFAAAPAGRPSILFVDSFSA